MSVGSRKTVYSENSSRKRIFSCYWLIFIWTWSGLFLYPTLVQASEAKELIGQFQVEDYLLQPIMTAGEKKTGGFGMAPSFLKVRWDNDEFFQGYFAIGTGHLRRAPLWGGTLTDNSTELILTEAYASLDFEFFWLQLGLQPVVYGFSGTSGETRWLFPFQLVDDLRWNSLRDFGFLIGARHRGYTTKLMAFNGEAGTNQDQEAWLAGSWSFDDNTSYIGATGITARLTPVTPQNLPVGAWIPVFKSNEKSQLRLLNGFWQVKARPVTVLLEFHKGELIQETSEALFDAWSLAVDWQLTESTQLGLQIDNFDPDQGASDVSYRRVSLGLSGKSENSRSEFGLVLSKNFESPIETLINDSATIYIKIAPQSRD